MSESKRRGRSQERIGLYIIGARGKPIHIWGARPLSLTQRVIWVIYHNLISATRHTVITDGSDS
jgi:hypothetical protein